MELDDVMERVADLDDEDLLDFKNVARSCASPRGSTLDSAVQPRGLPAAAQDPTAARGVAEHIVQRFAQPAEDPAGHDADLDEVEGVGDTRARSIKDGLARLAETSILERYT